MNAARLYPVTTIGELAPPASSSCTSSACACDGACKRASSSSSSSSMRGLEELTILYNPLAWAAQKLIGAGIARATGTDDGAQPGALDRLAETLGVDPVEVAIELTGFSGLGRYWPALQMIGGAAAIGGAAYLGVRAMRKRKTTTKTKKGKR
jgi:hypothetical protein